MPIDPQTGLDPETGMMGLKETHQPTGAIGAVMSYLNADKSRDISQALQQHRAASAQMAQQQADEYAARQARDDQVRKAIAALGPDANPEQLRMAFLQNGGDYKDVAPQYRAEISAGARMGATEIKARAEKYKAGMLVGVPLNELDRRFGAPNPEDTDLIRSLAGGGNASAAPAPAASPAPEQPKPGLPFLGPEQGPQAPSVGDQPAPLIGAKIAKLGTASDLDRTRGKSIEAKTPAEVDALKALASMRRLKDQIKAVKGTPSDSQILQWQRALTAKEDYLRKLRFDKYGDEYEMTPAREADIKNAEDEADDIRKIIKSKSSSAAGESAAATAKQSVFGAKDFGFASATTTPGGSTTAAGGTSSPKTVTKSIILPAP